MKLCRLSVLWLWCAVSVVLFSMVVHSMINRSLTERSAFFQAFEGHVLQNHMIATYQVPLALDCGIKCLRNSMCLSYNYKPVSEEHNECQLNDANKVTCPECYAVELDAIYYEDAKISSCIGRDGQMSNYDLYFPRKTLTSFVNQTWSVNMDMFTISFWMQTADSSEGTTFSYAVPNRLNELTIFKGMLAINDQTSVHLLGNFYDDLWHHVCVTWENTAGTWNLTVDSRVINNGSGFQVGHVIPGGGYLAIGQDQDDTPGDPSGFVLSQSFVGSITGMNVWSKVQPHDEILRMSKACNIGSGDVLKWSDFLTSRHGDVEVKCPSTCEV